MSSSSSLEVERLLSILLPDNGDTQKPGKDFSAILRSASTSVLSLPLSSLVPALLTILGNETSTPDRRTFACTLLRRRLLSRHMRLSSPPSTGVVQFENQDEKLESVAEVTNLNDEIKSVRRIIQSTLLYLFYNDKYIFPDLDKNLDLTQAQSALQAQSPYKSLRRNVVDLATVVVSTLFDPHEQEHSWPEWSDMICNTIMGSQQQNSGTNLMSLECALLHLVQCLDVPFVEVVYKRLNNDLLLSLGHILTRSEYQLHYAETAAHAICSCLLPMLISSNESGLEICRQSLPHVMSRLLQHLQNSDEALFNSLIQRLISVIGRSTNKSTIVTSDFAQQIKNLFAFARGMNFLEIRGSLIDLVRTCLHAEGKVMEVSMRLDLFNILIEELSWMYEGETETSTLQELERWSLQREDEVTETTTFDQTTDIQMCAQEALIQSIACIDISHLVHTCGQLLRDGFNNGGEQSRESCGRITAGWLLIEATFSEKSGDTNSKLTLQTELLDVVLRYLEATTSLGLGSSGSSSSPTPNSSSLVLHMAKCRWSAMCAVCEMVRIAPVIQETFGLLILTQMEIVIRKDTLLRNKARGLTVLCQMFEGLIKQREGNDDNDENRPIDNEIEAELANRIPNIFRDLLFPLLSNTLSRNTELQQLQCRTHQQDLVAASVFVSELAVAVMCTAVSFLGHRAIPMYNDLISLSKAIFDRLDTDVSAQLLVESALDLACRILVEGADYVGEKESQTSALSEQIARDTTHTLNFICAAYDRSKLKRSNDVPRINSGMFSDSIILTLFQAAINLLSSGGVTSSCKIDFERLIEMAMDILKIENQISVSSRFVRCPTLRRYNSNTEARVVSRAGMASITVPGEVPGLEKTVVLDTDEIEKTVAAITLLRTLASSEFVCHLPQSFTTTVFRAVASKVNSSFAVVRRWAVGTVAQFHTTVSDMIEKRAKKLAREGKTMAEIREDETVRTATHVYAHNLFEHAASAIGTLLAEGNLNYAADFILSALSDSIDGLVELRDLGFNVSPMPTQTSLFDWETSRRIVELIFDALGRVSVLALRKELEETTTTTDRSSENPHFEKSLADALQEAQEIGDDELDDGEGEDAEEKDITVIAAAIYDGVMQCAGRLMKVFGSMTWSPFCTHLKVPFGSLLSLNEASLVGRAAAIGLFADCVACCGPAAENEIGPNLLSIAIYFGRVSTNLSSNLIKRLTEARLSVQDFEFVRTMSETEETELLESVYEKIMCESESTEEYCVWLESINGEVTRLQSACYAIGVCVEKCARELVCEKIYEIEESFSSILSHPLALSSGRAGVCDCLCSAILRLVNLGHQGPQMLSLVGLTRLFGWLLPAREDFVEARFINHTLLNWYEKGEVFIEGKSVSLKNGGDGSLMSAEIHRILNHAKDNWETHLLYTDIAKVAKI